MDIVDRTNGCYCAVMCARSDYTFCFLDPDMEPELHLEAKKAIYKKYLSDVPITVLADIKPVFRGYEDIQVAAFGGKVRI